ncbi:MAG: putative peptidoglycan lipid flippase [Candidatus Parcubacteria bacterium]|jgi:putative peptidoglycan lipid II flippase|nr:putative peptidoglycan lipid flippase [Candidatus Parcubacteria bacterium]
MVRRIFSRLTAPVRGLHQAAYLLAGLTLASQVLALLRDRLFAHLFGAGEVLDLYYAAFRIPDLVFALVVSLVSAYVLIPRIAGLTEQGEKKKARELMSQTASFLLIGAGLIALVLAIVAPHALSALFPAFRDSAHAADFVLLSRLLLLQPILLGLSSILSSVTQLNRRFFLFALSPVLYNLGIILGTVLLYPYYGLIGIGIGVLIGAVAHLAVHVPVVQRAGLLPRLLFPDLRLLWGIARDSVPRSLALALGSFSTLLLVSLASRTGEGGVAVFTIAGNLETVPLSLIGAAYATAAFPVLAEQMGGKHVEAFRTTLIVAFRHVIFWSSVITVLAIVLRAHIVRVLYGTGAFGWDDTRLTAAIFAVLVVGLLAQGIVLLASRAFYASGRSWNPFLVQLCGLVLSIVSAYGLLKLAWEVPMVRYFFESMLRVSDVPGSGILLIALGATLGQVAMAVLALLSLRQVAPGVARSLARPLFEGLGAAILGGAAAYGALALMGAIAPLTKVLIVVAEGAVAGIVGLLVAGTVLSVLENQEFRDLASSLRRMTTAKALQPHGAIINDQTNT